MIKSKRGATGLLSAFCALVVAGGVAIAWPSDTGGEEAEPPPPANTPMAATMIRIGLDAERLCAAGASSTSATEVVEDVVDYLAANTGALPNADAAFAAARVAEDDLGRLVRSGLGTAAEAAAYQAAAQELSDAEDAREAVIAAMFSAGIADLTAAEQDALRTIRDNASWKLPVKYLVDDRTQQEWVDLRAALANHRIADQDGEAKDPVCTSLIASCDAVLDVASAGTNLSTDLAAVQTAWNTAVSK